METIYVTARKKVEALHQVPMSVQALSAERLRNYRVDDFQELTTYVPALEQPKLAIQSRLSLRGVSSGDNQSFEQAVGKYVDGIYRGRMNQHRSGFFDMERIEVLKGPQVTLYGNSSIGGAISMITKKPEFEFGGDIQVSYETEYQEKYVKAALNLPFTEEFAVRFAFKNREDDGIAYNEFTQTDEPKIDDSAMRFSALYEPNDKLSVHFRTEHSDFELNGHMMDIFMHVDQNGEPWPGSPYTGVNDGKMNVGNPELFTENETFWRTETDETALEVNYQWGDLTFTSLTGFSEYDYEQSYDTDFTTVSMINSYLTENYQQFSQEFRIAGSITDQLSFLAGIYYQDDELESQFFADFNQPLIFASIFAQPVSSFDNLSAPFSRVLTLDQDTEQWALLGSLDYQLTHALTLGLNYRYVDIEKTGQQASQTADIDHSYSTGDLVDTRWLSDPSLLANAEYLADPNNFGDNPALVPSHLFSYGFLSPNGQVHDLDLQRDEDHHMFQLSAKYQLNDSELIYASFANGAKAGGFDLYNESADPENAEFDDEKAKVFEVGYKANWQDLTLNIAAFYGEYDNLQTGIFNGGISLIVINAPSTISKGVDVEFDWQITDALSAFVYGEYLDFYYDDFEQAPCSRTTSLETGNTFCDWKGEPMPFVPDFKVNLGLEHYYSISNQFDLRQLLTYSYKDDYTTASDNEQQTKQDGYGLVDYRIDLINNHYDYQVGLSIQNATDEDYTSYTTIMPLAPGGAFAKQLEKGRQIAIEASYHF
ncbi:TonB-dependent receptor [Catenovulum sp. SM1970]|uniref:TonB-dependent receptor n=1 Tax=Marinifaba aquimaris TaxID=2741323 RepID=UPI0015741860|nr:TonB-dependent receptor [Marinifaba aquimaris]NTS78729.1 TonB-dependent receptor [Marinifaba aquimaris]